MVLAYVQFNDILKVSTDGLYGHIVMNCGYLEGVEASLSSSLNITRAFV